MKVNLFRKGCFLISLVVLVVFTLFVSSEITQSVYAEANWPERPLRIIVTFSAGGSNDRVARTIASFLPDSLGQPVLVENRSGASGLAGTMSFLQEEPDGYFLVLNSQPHLANNILLMGGDFDISDIAAINIMVSDPITITVHKDSPYENLIDLINAMKISPGKIAWGIVPGGSGDLAVKLLFDVLKIEGRIVNYEGGATVRTALLGKHVDVIAGTAEGDIALGDQVRVLGLFNTTQHPLWPKSPTVNEQLSKLNIELPTLGVVRFLAVHRDFKEQYPERWDILVAAIEKTVKSKDFQKFVSRSGMQIQWLGPEKSQKTVDEITTIMEKYINLLKK